jgi:hypothetical protein
MTPTAAAWIRKHAWPTELAHTHYRNEHLCSCQWPCDCQHGQHQYCISPDGTPSLAVSVAIVYGSRHTAYSSAATCCTGSASPASCTFQGSGHAVRCAAATTPYGRAPVPRRCPVARPRRLPVPSAVLVRSPPGSSACSRG